MSELPPAWESAPEPGWVSPALGSEHPGLGTAETTVEAASGRSPEDVRDRLRILGDRYAGAQAILLRQQPVPNAYRVFFRQIGIDPDAEPTPVEAISLERMKRGRFRSQNRLDDAITIATMETGVAVVAFDSDRLQGRVGIRVSEPGEKFEGRSSPLPEGTMVLADSERAVAVLFGRMADGRGVRRRTTRIRLVAVRVPGVPDISVEEALWLAASTLHA